MANKTIQIDSIVHKKAKILAAQYDLTLKDVIEYLLEGLSDKEIEKIAKKK